MARSTTVIFVIFMIPYRLKRYVGNGSSMGTYSLPIGMLELSPNWFFAALYFFGGICEIYIF